MESETRTIGILGGTFDPPHRGHVELAEYVARLKSLDMVLFLPANLPPLQNKKPVASFAHRMKMVGLATADSPLLGSSDLEGRRGGLSYSIDTIREIRREYGLSAESLYFIVGVDAFAGFDRWREPEAVLSESSVLVLAREGERRRFNPDFLEKAQLLSNEIVPVSSSEIRRILAEDGDVSNQIPPSVLEYIRVNRLYIGQ